MPIYYRDPNDTEFTEVTIEVDRPPSEDIRKYDRARRYQILHENSTKRRNDLLKWIEENGLSNEVSRVGEPTAFNLVFVTATPKAAKALENAPGVIGVSIPGDGSPNILHHE